jgi:hypothetical protein
MDRRFVRLRLPLTIATALSLVLLPALVCCYFYLGAAGYVWKISGSTTGGERYIAVGNQGGVIGIGLGISSEGSITRGSRVSQRGPFFWWTMPVHDPWGSFRASLWSFSAETQHVGDETDHSINFPVWLLIALCAVAPSMWIRRYRQHRRRKRDPQLCPHCGYDRRATAQAAGPLLPRCPECGHPTDARLHAAL